MTAPATEAKQGGTPATVSRGDLLAALAGPEPERALEQAMPLLPGTRDTSLVFEVTKALVRGGLAGIAVRVLRALEANGASSELAPLVAPLVNQIARLPSGEVPRQALRERWARRREALARVKPSLADALPERLPDDVVAFRSAKGNVHLLREGSPGEVAFVLPFEDSVGRAAGIALPGLEATTSSCVLGLPSPALFRRLLEQVSPTGYEPPIDIVECDAELAALWLALIDDAEPFCGDRCWLFAGPEAYQAYQSFLIGHPWRTPALNTLTIRRHGVAPPALDEEFYAPIRRHAAEASARHRDKVTERYRNRDLAFWHERYATSHAQGKPLRFIGFTSRFSTVMRHALPGIAAAFERCGCLFDVVMQPSASAAGVDVPGTLAAHDYAGIVLINHLRFEYGAALPSTIPVVSWIQDYMERLCSREAGASIGELDLVLAHAPDVLAALYGYPKERCIGTSNLTDAGQYANELLPEEELAPYRCDVSFVSHGSESPEELVEQIAHGSAPTMRRLLELALRRMRDALNVHPWIHAHGLVELMLSAEREVGVAGLTPELRRAHLYPQIARIYDRLFRHQALEWTARWVESRGRTLRLYGMGWERHPRFGRYACGLVEGGRPLRALFQASRVSLQVNGHSSLHQRLLDGLAAGGFLLTRTNPADFIRAPFASLAERIRREPLTSLGELVRLRERDASFDATCAEAERLVGVVMRERGHAEREAHVRTTKQGNSIESICSDEGLFGVLRELTLIPTRVANDLPGFAATCFSSEADLHASLDRYVDDASARQEIARPMRDAVLAHDTYDGLVRQVLAHFGAPSGGST
jgi:hypothetical protein